MIPQSEVTLTLVNNGRNLTITFPPGSLHIEEQGNGMGVVHYFSYNGNEYFLHESGTHPQTSAQKAVRNIAHAAADVGSASTGAHFGQGYGKKGILVGALVGLGVSELVTHFPSSAHSDDGYYNNGEKYFEGPVHVNIR